MKPWGKKGIGMMCVTMSLLVATESKGTIGLNIECPDIFTAKVQSISSPEAPSNKAYSRVRVQLMVIKDLSGKTIQDELKTFEVLKYSQSNFELGATYEVAMRDKWLCRFKKIN